MLPGKKIAVLMGGTSAEREVSLQSGRAVSNALRRTENEVVEIIVNDEEVNELGDYQIDVAFIALHGRFGEDGGIQRILESRGIPYTGSGVSASELAMNKHKSKKIFKRKGITTPDYIVVSNGQSTSEIAKEVEAISLPVVTKPTDNGSSVGISIIRECGELRNGIELARAFGKEVLIEKYIEGRELAVGILNDSPLPVVEIKTATEFYDYDSKYKDERTQYIVLKSGDAVKGDTLLSSTYVDARELAVLAHQSLGCRCFSRVDMILDGKGHLYVLEVNTIPGFTERSLLPKAAAAINIEFTDLCKMVLNAAIKFTVRNGYK